MSIVALDECAYLHHLITGVLEVETPIYFVVCRISYLHEDSLHTYCSAKFTELKETHFSEIIL